MATSPASMPLAIMPGSGLPVRRSIQNMAATAPNAAAMAVLATTIPMPESVADSVDAPLKPNQPNSRIIAPRIAIGMWWPGSARGLPSLSNFPMRGPSTMMPASAATPPIACTTPEPAKSTYPKPRSRLFPSWLSQPPPQVHAPNSGYQIPAQKKPQTTKLFHRHRSAMAPVGMVAVASMNATM